MKAKDHSMNPFPGLRPFRQDEDYLFFGREEQTMELLQRLGTHRFVAVVGTSGSGKSSLVRCGLLSELLGGKLLRAGASWEVAVTHPGGNPLALLAEAILEADLYDREEEHARDQLLATLSRSQFGLIEAIKQARLPEHTNFLLVVDQFEEVFRFNEAGQTQQEMASDFIALLLEAVVQTEVPIYVVLTMRSDFIGDCGQFEGLAEMVNRGEFLIPRLSREQYKRIIESPIKVAGGQIAPRLLQRLLNDLGQQADQLPCLQHAMMRTWSVWSERGDTEALDLDDYQRVGRMSEALSLHADEVFDSLQSDRQRELCAGMFKALTIQESENRGIRRPQRLGGLCQILEVPLEELRPIIDAFRQQHVTFLMPAPEVELTDKTIVDISHESLMRVWARLRRWVEEEAQAVGIYRRLTESATLHDQGKAGLYRDPELGIALAWREASRPNRAWAERYHPGFTHAMEFLDASQQAHLAEEQEHEAGRQRELEQARMLAEAQLQRAEAETRSARRLRVLLAGTAVIALFAIGASLVALNSWREADWAKQAAELSESSARQNALTAQAAAERATLQEAAAKAARIDSEQNLTRARIAIDEFLIQVSDSKLMSTPGLQPLRAELLESAGKFYLEFLAKNPDNPELRAGLADAFYRVGFVKNELSNPAEALQALEKSLALWKLAIQADPEDASARRGMAAVWFEIARARQAGNDDSGSYDAARESARLWKTLAEAHPRDLTYQKSLARAYNMMGISSNAPGTMERAFLAYRKSLQIRLALLPEDPDDVELLHGLAESFNNLGLLVTDSEQRLAMLQRSVEFNVKVNQLRPQNVEYAVDLGIGYLVAGAQLIAMDRKQEALDSFRQGVDHMLQFMRANPAVPAMRGQLAVTLSRLRIMPIEPDHADAYVRIFAEVHDTLAAMTRKTADEHFAFAQAQSDYAAQLFKARQTVQRRELTAAESTEIANLRAGALDALRVAVAAGFKDQQRLKQDPLLADVRTQAAFNEIVASTETAGPSGAATDVADPHGEDQRIHIAEDRATGYLAFGMIETALGRYEQARQSFDQALAAHGAIAQSGPANEEHKKALQTAQAALATLLVKEGRLREARDILEERIALLQQTVAERTSDQALADAHRQLADALAGEALWEAATPHYAAALKWQAPIHEPQSADYREILAPALHLLDGDEESYRAGCAQVLAKFGATRSAEQATRVARLCALRPGAVADLAPIVDLAEQATDGWHAYTYALTLYRAARFQDAIQAIRAAQAKKSLDGVYVDQFVLAMAHFQSGRRTQAQEILHAINRRSLQAMASWNHSTHNMLDVDWIVLRHEANELVFGSPFSADDRFRRARAYAQLTEVENTEAECAAMAEASPEDPRGHVVRARMLAQMNRRDEAETCLRQAHRLLDRPVGAYALDPALWRVYGEAFERLGQHDAASDAFRHAFAAQSVVVLRSSLRNDRLLLELNDQLRQSLQSAGRELEATAAQTELSNVLAVRALPPVLKDADDLLTDADQRPSSPGDLIASIDGLLAAQRKSPMQNALLQMHLSAPLHVRRAELLRDGGGREMVFAPDVAAAREQLQQLLAADPDNAELAADLARMLLFSSATPWTTLEPVTLQSAAGTTLTLQPDGTILASGISPDNETYSVTAKAPFSGIAAVRLEALPHPSLPKSGSGRDRNGWFRLGDFTVSLADPGQPPASAPALLKLRKAVASHRRKGQNDVDPPLEIALSDQAATWDAWPEVYRLQEMICDVAPSPGNSRETLLTIRLSSSGGAGSRPTLGCFRLSVSNEPRAYQREFQRLTAAKLADPWARLGAAWAMNGRHAEAAKYIAGALQRAGSYEARIPILEFAAGFDELLLTLAEQQPNDPQLQLAAARNLAERGKTQLAEKRPAQAQADLQKAGEIFTRLDAENPEPKWTVLRPTEMKSDAGETFAVEPDGSIFVTGPNPEHAVYTLKLRTELPTLSAIRLETIPDQRLPSYGAGRAGNGNFHVAELKASFVPGNADGQAMPITFNAAVADFEQSWNPAQRTIDGNARTWWDTHPRIQHPHWLLLACETPVKSDGRYLSITLEEGITQYPKHGLGRFRLLATDEPDVQGRTKLRKDFSASELMDLRIALATAQAQQGEPDDAATSFTEAAAVAADRAARARIISQAASLPGVLEKLAQQMAGTGSFRAQLAEYFADRDPGPLANAARDNALTVLEQQLAADPDDAASASELGDLLLSKVAVGKQYWIDDEPPPGARLQGDTPWEFVSKPDHPVFSGQKSIRRKAQARSQHFFSDATASLKVGDGARLFAHVYLDPRDPPRTLMLQFCDGGWEHRAYWGEDLIDWGDKGTAGHAPMGPLPKAGEWVRLEVEPARVGLRVGGELNGWAFSQYGGTCYWDAAGCTHSFRTPWQKLAAAWHLLDDQAALDKLLAHHPEATAGIGDLYAAQEDWEAAIVEYSKAISAKTNDHRIFAARAQAYERLERWELAAADWGAADLNAPDKKGRYGNPALPYLEHRFYTHGRLQKYDEQVRDCTELLKPERLGNEPWIYVKRGESYDRLRQWDRARADYETAITASSPTDRGTFQFFLARHLAAQGRWKQAAEDVRKADQKPTDSITNWWARRDAALIYTMAGDIYNGRRAAVEQLRKQPQGDPDADQNKWAVFDMLLIPNLVTSENLARLLELAGKTDSYWQPRLTASLQYRTGDCEKAAELFDANHGGAQFVFLAAMVHHTLGHHDRAKQLLEEGNAWLRSERAKGSDGLIPPGHSWQDWATILVLQLEATDVILDPEAGSPRKLALTGQTRAAAEAYAKALAAAADEDSKSRIISELAQFEDVLTALHQRLPEDRPIQNEYRGIVERAAAEFGRQLDVFAGQGSADKNRKAELISSVVLRQDDVLEALLKLRPDDSLLHAANAVVTGDWKNAAAGYAKVIMANDQADSVARMVPPTLFAYANDTEEYRKACQQMYERYRDSTVPNDIERSLKMMLLVDDGPPLPPTAVQAFYDSFAGDLTDDNRAWFLATRALLECRKGNYSQAHQLVDESLGLEKKVPNAFIKILALSIRSLTYAHQKEVEQARASLEQVKQLMMEDLKMDWNSDGLLKGSTVLDKATINHDKLIPEIIRRETAASIAAPAE
jgi:tetratricopeptide (TPR) repeat protein